MIKCCRIFKLNEMSYTLHGDHLIVFGQCPVRGGEGGEVNFIAPKLAKFVRKYTAGILNLYDYFIYFCLPNHIIQNQDRNEIT